VLPPERKNWGEGHATGHSCPQKPHLTRESQWLRSQCVRVADWSREGFFSVLAGLEDNGYIKSPLVKMISFPALRSSSALRYSSPRTAYWVLSTCSFKSSGWKTFPSFSCGSASETCSASADFERCCRAMDPAADDEDDKLETPCLKRKQSRAMSLRAILRGSDEGGLTSKISVPKTYHEPQKRERERLFKQPDISSKVISAGA
jgi:hypothetical protein